MQDIRSELQERINFVHEQIKGTADWYEKTVARLQRERDGRTSALQSELDALTVLMDVEQQRRSGPQRQAAE